MALGKKLAEGRLKASGSTVLLREVLRSWWRGQHGLRCTGGKQLLRGGAHRLRWFGAKSGERKGGGCEQGLWVDPVLGAELLQWSRAAGMQWNDRPTAEPKLGAAERIVAAALGFAGRRYGGLGSRGVRGAN
jgi:hypothetical protein